MRRDLPPEIYVTREFVISFRKSPRDFPGLEKRLKVFPLKFVAREMLFKAYATLKYFLNSFVKRDQPSPPHLQELPLLPS